MKYLKQFDGFRFVAAIMIFISHMSIVWKNTQFAWLWENYLNYFYTGVSIFFILSGFVLTYKYYPKLVSTMAFPIKRFYLNRIIHLYPLHLVTTLMALPMQQANNFSTNRLLSQLFLVQSFNHDPTYYFSFNPLSWFLSDLFFLYLLFPLIITIFARVKFNTYIKLCAFIFILAIYSILYVNINQSSGNTHYFFYISPLIRIIEFCSGIILALILYAFSLDISSRKLAKLRIAFIQIFALLIFVLSVYYAHYIPPQWSYSLYFVLPIALLIFALLFSDGLISKVLSSRLLMILGKLSFPFLMVHVVILLFFTKYYQFTSLRHAVIITGVIFLLSLCFAFIYSNTVNAVFSLWKKTRNDYSLN